MAPSRRSRIVETIGRPPWKVRRRIVYATLAFCAVIVGYLAAAGEDTRLNEVIAWGLIALAGGVIGSYVFGAVWDDLNVMRTLGPQAYQDQLPPQAPAGQSDGVIV